ncbi:amidohydrolase family protein [Croceicoccus sp. F390]|uniref:Amidohydrolase family protein n=1 Tax=Croceicoccus esteveae TaxID=3075597 RepID=A0ABU2ZGG0_9SPHN|nr:amidohydrolase family protein [Croceicoccus sp. F390]MDT0575678.1 amidohydrolase family protein [Croceicoccus sp. F390]
MMFLRSRRPLLLSLAMMLALTGQNAAADTLVDNVDGMRFDRDGTVTRFAAMLVDDDGRVRQIYDQGQKLPRDVDYRLDGGGRTLLPGFVDAHLHVSDIGFAALTLDLSDTRSLAEARQRIALYAEQNPERAWIIGRGWNQEAWGLGQFPTAAQLDDLVTDRPVWLQRVDGHAGWANSAALVAAGIDVTTADPAGGRIERIGTSRQPAGVLVDNAMALIDAALPPVRAKDRDLALEKAQQILLARGITAVADMGTTLNGWQSYRRAGDLGRLQLRIVGYAAGTVDMEAIAGPGPTPWLYGDRLRLAGVKLYMDGALGSRGAWLKQPYADAATQTGLPLLSGTQMRNLMSRAALEGFQVAVHAIGDAANSEVLDAIAELNETYTGDRRWRIEHAQIVDPGDIARFAQLGTVASMQPQHQTSDWQMAQARLGPDRLTGAYAWAAMEDAGVPLAFGSDAPVEQPDVFAGLAAAISRMDATGQPAGGWLAEQRIVLSTALAAYTSGAAWAQQAEGRFGSLREGEWADFILLSANPFDTTPANLRAIEVLETWIAGRRVYAADKQQTGNKQQTGTR